MSFADVTARLLAIVLGRGSDGALGAEAQALAIPTGLFRATDLDPSLDAIDGGRVDRAVKILLRDRVDAIPRNSRSPKRDHFHRITVRVGYITALGGDAWKAVHLGPDGGGESEQRAAITGWESRAHDDANRIAEALLQHVLTGADTNPIIENVVHINTQTVSRDNGRGYCDAEFEVWTEESV